MHPETHSERVGAIEMMMKEWGIRPTPVRVLVLKELLESGRPMSALELETSLQTVDRSSITRTLSVFSESHLIHQISDGSGAMRYEVCTDKASEIHNDEHAHFHCRKCGKTYCLPELRLKIPKIPAGYEAEDISYVITGICPKCR